MTALTETFTGTGATTDVSLEPLPLWDALLERWIAFCDVRKGSRETYRRAVNAFLDWLRAEGITTPDREDVICWRESLRESHKATTITNYLTAVRMFFRWLSSEGLAKNIADHVKPPKVTAGHKKDYLTSAQAHSVLEGIDTATVKGLRDYAIIGLMLTTGLRTIEVSRADVQDIRTAGDSVVLYVQGKGRDEKAEYVKLAPQVEKAIRAYLKTRGTVAGDDPLFASTSNNGFGGRMSTKAISTLAKASMVNVGLESDRLTAHSMRHTAGTLALLRGASVREVQQLLRHSNLNTTLLYAHDLDRAANNAELTVANAVF